MIDLVSIIAAKRAFLDGQIKEAVHTRDSAPAPTESHSDKTRQNAEQLIDKYQDEKKILGTLEREVLALSPVKDRAAVGNLVTLKTPTGTKNFLLVPNGLGGQFVGDIYLLSASSPLASQFLNQKEGHVFNFNGGVCSVLYISPNL